MSEETKVIDVHNCENLIDAAVIGKVEEIHFKDYPTEWFLSIADIKVAIRFCPFCGKKLE